MQSLGPQGLVKPMRSPWITMPLIEFRVVPEPLDRGYLRSHLMGSQHRGAIRRPPLGDREAEPDVAERLRKHSAIACQDVKPVGHSPTQALPLQGRGKAIG